MEIEEQALLLEMTDNILGTPKIKYNTKYQQTQQKTDQFRSSNNSIIPE